MPRLTRTAPRTLFAALGIFVAAAALANLAPEGQSPAGPDIVPSGPGIAPHDGSAWDYKALPRAEIVKLAPGHRGEYIMPKDLLGDFNAGLDVLGADGWELAAVEPYHKEGYVSWPALYVFRRPK